MAEHEKAIEAAATAACGVALTDNGGKNLSCTYPDCDCDRVFIRREARAAIAAFLRAVEPSEHAADKGQHVNSEWLNDNAPLGERRYREPAKATFIAMCRALAEEINSRAAAAAVRATPQPPAE